MGLFGGFWVVLGLFCWWGGFAFEVGFFVCGFGCFLGVCCWWCGVVGVLGLFGVGWLLGSVVVGFVGWVLWLVWARFLVLFWFWVWGVFFV
ncbi:hypothetical protein, partial [Neisseria sp. P0019.S002]|uniref:hypothetical protein n=1 Tax=Neisseria sp. P0019.S002 TaxID=3436798 RepID=UPI003F7F8AF7